MWRIIRKFRKLATLRGRQGLIHHSDDCPFIWDTHDYRDCRCTRWVVWEA